MREMEGKESKEKREKKGRGEGNGERRGKRVGEGGREGGREREISTALTISDSIYYVTLFIYVCSMHVRMIVYIDANR